MHLLPAELLYRLQASAVVKTLQSNDEFWVTAKHDVPYQEHFKDYYYAMQALEVVMRGQVI
jgi:hypothetical protein